MSYSPHLKVDLAIGWGEGSWRALDGIVGLPGLDVDIVVEVEAVVVVIAVAGVEEMAAVALRGASWSKTEGCSVAEEDRTRGLVEAGSCTIFRHLPLRRGRPFTQSRYVGERVWLTDRVRVVQLPLANWAEKNNRTDNGGVVTRGLSGQLE